MVECINNLHFPCIKLVHCIIIRECIPPYCKYVEWQIFQALKLVCYVCVFF